MEALNTLFKHNNWFNSYNKETNKYEPYTTKKEALQYFVSCGDFINDNGVLRYTGKEKGSYRMNQEEQKYFIDLKEQKAEAYDEGKYIYSVLKSKISENNKRVEENVVFKNTIICVVGYFGSENYPSIHVEFLDYIIAHGGETKEKLLKLIAEKNHPFLKNEDQLQEEKLINLFLDWKNNFLSINYFAEYYSMTIEKANSLINKGRELNEKRAGNKQNLILN